MFDLFAFVVMPGDILALIMFLVLVIVFIAVMASYIIEDWRARWRKGRRK